MDERRLLEDIAVAAREAGEAILEIVRRGYDIEHKQDSSPVTEADRAAELLQETLDEEGQTDKLLTELAESAINIEAASAEGDEEEEEQSARGGRTFSAISRSSSTQVVGIPRFSISAAIRHTA